MVFKDCKFVRIRQGIILTIFFSKEIVNLCRSEFMGISSMNPSDDRIARRDSGVVSSSDQIP